MHTLHPYQNQQTEIYMPYSSTDQYERGKSTGAEW